MTKMLTSIDGGELHFKKGNIKTEMIPFLVTVVGEIFSDLKEIKSEDRIFSYCVNFDPSNKKTVEAILIDIEHNKFPEGVGFYESDGRRIFEIRGPSGGVTTSMCFYVVAK